MADRRYKGEVRRKRNAKKKDKLPCVCKRKTMKQMPKKTRSGQAA
jgi:hypothetical protein